VIPDPRFHPPTDRPIVAVFGERQVQMAVTIEVVGRDGCEWASGSSGGRRRECPCAVAEQETEATTCGVPVRGHQILLSVAVEVANCNIARTVTGGPADWPRERDAQADASLERLESGWAMNCGHDDLLPEGLGRVV